MLCSPSHSMYAMQAYDGGAGLQYPAQRRVIASGYVP